MGMARGVTHPARAARTRPGGDRSPLAPPPYPATRNAEPNQEPTEAALARCWERQAFERGGLCWPDGAPLAVIYPGRRRAGGRGPDFVDAILARGGELRHGGVELHLRASGWREHGHERDPAYLATILHVVLQDDGVPARRSDGSEVPTIVLAGRGPQLEEPEAAPAPTACGDPHLVWAAVEAAGLARFRARATAFAGDLALLPPHEVVYRGLVEALGYRANRLPCRRLAETAPLQAWQRWAAAQPAGVRIRRLQGALLGAAGLLDGGFAPGDPEEESLVRGWEEAEHEFGPPLPRALWERSGLRPANHPARRLAALAVLLSQRWATGVVEALAGALRRDESARGGALALVEALIVPADDYWAGHLAPGRALRRPLPGLIGRSRALAIAASVALPALAAWGEVGGDQALARRALACYLALPAGAGNQITRHMARQVAGPSARPPSACAEQGLLHLYQRSCSARACGTCDLSLAHAEGGD